MDENEEEYLEPNAEYERDDYEEEPYEELYEDQGQGQEQEQEYYEAEDAEETEDRHSDIPKVNSHYYIL